MLQIPTPSTNSPNTGPRPLYNATQAVARALLAVGHHRYELGTGDIDTELEGDTDCVWAAVNCYGIRRHRPGFNRTISGHPRSYAPSADGAAPSVVDDVNCNSEIEDALYLQELFVARDPRQCPEEGDVLAWPTISLYHPSATTPYFKGTGHNAIVVRVTDYARLHWTPGAFQLLQIAQCVGPNGHKPGVILSDGSAFSLHAQQWGKPEHTSWALSVRP